MGGKILRAREDGAGGRQVNLDRALAVSSGLVALSGLLALLLTMEAPAWLVVPAMALTVAVSAKPGKAGRVWLPGPAQTALTVCAFIFSVMDFLYIGGSLVTAAADLMVLLMCIKLASLNEGKDYVQLFAAALFVLLASTALSTEIYFLVPFLIFFVSAGWALMLLTVKTESEAVSGRPARFQFGGGFFGGTAALSIVAFFVTLAIFFTIPRIGVGFMSRRAGGLLRTSGFSDTVDLGSMGEIKLDPSVVMRVRLPGADTKPDLPFYWRGRTFDLYDGRSWTDTIGGETVVYSGRSGNFSLRRDGPIPGEMLVQEVALEPLDTAIIFALNPAYFVRADFRMLHVGRAGELSVGYPPGSRLHYTVYSAPGEGSYRPDDLPVDKYLRLPEDSERTAALAREVTGGIPDAMAKAGAVMDFLAKGYAYSLDPPRDRSLSPMDDFLFKSKTGYCEQFATAMVLMLRGAGVHARIVSGFMGGEWNGYGGYFLVREQDAHTWVEAYLPGTGWTVFDPTPPSAPGGASGATGGAGRAIDYLKFRWDRYIVYYNLKDQLAAAGWLSDAYAEAKAVGRDMFRAMREGLPSGKGARATGAPRNIAALAGLIVLVVAAGYAAWRYAGGRRTAGRVAAVWFYARMEKALKKKGYERKPGTTPMEFARALPAGAQRLDESAFYVTEMYYRVRYGGGMLDGAEQDRLKRAVESMEE